MRMTNEMRIKKREYKCGSEQPFLRHCSITMYISSSSANFLFLRYTNIFTNATETIPLDHPTLYTHSILSLNSRKTNNIKYLCFVFTLFFLSRQGLRCSLTDKFLTQQLYEQRRNITISRMQEKRIGYY